MLMRSWIRQLFTRRVTRPIRKMPHRVRMALEEMETRWLPSTIVVNNPTDTPVVGEIDLRQAIVQANTTGGDETITFDSTVFSTPQTITLSGSQLELSDVDGTETIEGPAVGVTISGGGQSRVFQVDAGVIASFSGLTITGGNSTNGGGLANYSGSVSLTDCTVSGNTANGGGGLYTSGSGGMLELTNCTISGNYAYHDGGGVDSWGSGNSLTMTNCTISGNHSAGEAGGIYEDSGTVSLNNSSITNNYSYLDGGGLTNYNGSLTLTNCTVSGNTMILGSGSDGGPGQGGGGGLFTSGSVSSLVLTNCTISGNTASRADGGGIYQDFGTISLTNSNINNNYSFYNGGGLDNYAGSLTLTGCSVSGNTMIYGSGGYGGSGTGDGGGGGVFSSGNSNALVMTNCTVSDNKAVRGTGGGVQAVTADYGTATLTDCTVSGNASWWAGAGVYTSGSGTGLVMTNSTVSGNTAYWNGGGVYTFGSSTALTMTNCTVSGNSSTSSAAGVGNFGSATATLSNCTICNNTMLGVYANTAGGGVYNAANSTAILTNCTVSGNSANGAGGGVYNSKTGGVAVLGNTIVASNTSTTTGPDAEGHFDSLGNNLIGQKNGSTGWIGSDLTGTSSKPLAPRLSPLGFYGGPTETMALLPGSPAIGTGVTQPGTTDQRGLDRPTGPSDIGAFQSGPLVVNTTADTDSFGALTLRDAVTIAGTDTVVGTSEPITFDSTVFATPQTITLNGTQLELNAAGVTETITGPSAGVTISGGGLSRVFQVDLGVTVTLSGLTISGGNASNGGGVANYSDSLTLNDCTVSGNTATNGGGVYTYVYGGTLVMTNCTVSGNTASGEGGGVNQNTGTVTLTNCTIDGNTALNGGGVANYEGTLTLTNCTVSSNAAPDGNGGGLDGGGNISNSIFDGNSSMDGGGIYNAQLGQLTTNNSTFFENTASVKGGGVFNSGTFTASNNTFFENNARLGGGLYTQGSTLLNGNILVGNLGAGHTVNDIQGSAISTSSSSNLVGTDLTGSLTNGVFGNQVGVSVAQAALAAPSSNGGPTETCALLPGSFALGHGLTSLSPSFDQRGVARPIGQPGDVGAFQLSASPIISNEPTSEIVTSNEDASFSTAASDTYTDGSSVAISVQWEISTNGGRTFTSIAPGGVYGNSVTSDTLTIASATASMTGYEYEAVFTNPAGQTATTTPVILTVDYVKTNPSNLTLDAGQTATFTAATSNLLGTDKVQWQVNTNNGNGFTNISGANSTTLTISNTTASENGYEYQAVFTNTAFSGSLLTSPATLSVDSLTANPSSVTLNAGQTATFTAASSNPLGTDKVQWQVNTNNGNGFTNIGGANSTTLTISNTTASENGYEYQAVFTNTAYSGSLITSPATLTIDHVSINPSNVTVILGQTTTFTTASSNPLGTDSVQWQVNTNNGNGFTNISGANNTTLTISNTTTSENGYEYRAVFANTAYGGTLTTSTAMLSVDYVTANPNNVTLNVGQTGTFTAATSNLLSTDSVQWQINTNNGNGFTNISGANSTTLTISNASASENNYQYRAVFTNTAFSGSLITSPAILSVDSLTANPSNVTLNVGQTATFTAASTNPLGTDNVQWQVNTNNGNGFTNIGGANSTTLTISNTTASENNYQYRAVFTNTAYSGSLTTSPATLTIDHVSTNPSNVTLNAGQTATFTAASSNPLGTDSVQWQVNTNNGNGFTNISGADSTTLTISNTTASENGYEYQAVFTNTAYGGTLITSPATLTIDHVNSNPGNVTVNTGQTTIFTATSSNPLGTDSVQWQVNTNNGNGFTNISGANSTTLVFGSTTASENGYQYRAIFTNTAYGGSLTTNAATLTVDYAPIVVTNPKMFTVEAGQNASLTAVASGNPSPNAQWQVSTDNGVTFTNVNNVGVFSGANTNTLTITDATASMNGYEYRAVFSSTLSGTSTPSTATTSVADSFVYIAPNPQTSTVSLSSNSVQIGSSVTVTLQAKDSSGNDILSGGPAVTFGLLSITEGYGTFSRVIDNGNGTYTATFTGSITGTAAITATINGQTITSGSPTINVTSVGVSMAKSIVTVSSPGVQSGSKVTVELQAENANGQDLTTGGLNVTFGLGSVSGGQGTFGPVTDNGNGSYSATFTGTLTGTNTVIATIDSQQVTSTAPAITVTAGPVNLTNSLVMLGVPSIQLGGITTITLQAKDAAGNDETSGGLNVKFALGSTTGAKGTLSSVTDNKNGTYTATFTGTTDGTNTLVATIGGLPVTSTPPSITVTGAAVSVAKSTLKLSSTTAQSGSSTTITLQAEDAKGNNETSGGLMVSFKLGSTHGGQGTFGQVTDNGNGTYTVSFTGTIAGTNTIVATINGHAITSTAPTIKVTPGPVSLANSLVALSVASIKVGGTTKVTLQAKDAAGNNETVGGLTVLFALVNSTGGLGTFGTVTDNHNGTYTVTFTGTVAGSNAIEATINNSPATSIAPTIKVT